jgi:rubrerythrin
MEQFSIREVIEQAVQTEKLGNAFYTEMASRFEDDSKLQELFNTLALKELEHEKKFQELTEKIGSEMLENWDEASLYLRAIVESEFFLGNNKSLPSLEHLNSGEEAVKYALGFEKETLLYYHGLKDSVKDKEILNEIIDEEKSHIRWLSDIRKNLT